MKIDLLCCRHNFFEVLRAVQKHGKNMIEEKRKDNSKTEYSIIEVLRYRCDAELSKIGIFDSIVFFFI